MYNLNVLLLALMQQQLARVGAQNRLCLRSVGSWPQYSLRALSRDVRVLLRLIVRESSSCAQYFKAR